MRRTFGANARPWSTRVACGAFVVVAAWIGDVSTPVAAHALQAQAPPSAPDSLSLQVERLSDQIERLSRIVDSVGASALAASPDTAIAVGAGGAVSDVLDTASTEAKRLGFRALVALLVIVLASWTVRATSWLLSELAERVPRRRLTFKRLEPISLVLLWAIAAFVVLRGVFAIEASTLLAASAAIGVAVGFAAQDIIKNIFGGLVIISDRPFQVGDKIAVGGTYGEVTAIGLRSTRLVTPDDNLVTVPNSQIVDGQVSNANAGALDCQVVTDLYLPGWVDVAHAKDVAYRAAMTSRFVFTGKPVVVLAKDEFHETFVTHLKVKAYVLDIRFEFAFMSDVTERARVAFREAGILPPWHGAQPRVQLGTATTDVLRQGPR